MTPLRLEPRPLITKRGGTSATLIDKWLVASSQLKIIYTVTSISF